STIILPQQISTLFPYTTLSRSDLYNNFISVRRPSSEYLRNLQMLNEKIVEYRKQWSDDISVEPESGSITVATLHIDSSAAESMRSEEHTSELQSLRHLVCRLLL